MAATELADDLHWLSHCETDGDRHLHLSEYLLAGEDGYVLVDSGSSIFREEIVAEVNDLTGGAGPDVVVLAHQVLPHKENLPAFEAEWGDLEVVTSVPRLGGLDLVADVPGFTEILGVSGARGTVYNRPRELAGRPITCIRPLLTDVTVSQWIYDHDAAVLFTAEVFGHYHGGGECTLTSAEMDGGIDYDHVEGFYRDKLTFLDQLDLGKMRTALELLLDRLDPAYVAPIHGNPVANEDLDGYVDDVVEAMDVPAEPSPATRSE